MANRGVSPVDVQTEVGQLRSLVHDVISKPISPTPEMGYADYANFSDDDLSVALAQAGGNLFRAAGVAYMGLAAVYAAIGKSIKTDDLNLDIRQRGTDLLEVAKTYFAEADKVDAAGASDAFEIVPFNSRIWEKHFVV